MSALVQQRCQYHHDREAVARCPDCRRFYCRECVTEHEDRMICASCLRRLTGKTDATGWTVGRELGRAGLFVAGAFADFSGRSDYGPFIRAGIPAGGLFAGAEGIKTAAEAALWGGVAGVAYDPCYHLACDTYVNNSDEALHVNSDGLAYAVLHFAMNTSQINDAKAKGHFK